MHDPTLAIGLARDEDNMDLVEGREFNLDSPNEWECLLVNRNEIIEVHLPSTNLECLSNLWAGFWVKQVVMSGNGDSGRGISQDNSIERLGVSISAIRSLVELRKSTPCT